MDQTIYTKEDAVNEKITLTILLHQQLCFKWVLIRPVVLLLLCMQFHYFHQAGYYVTKNGLYL